MEKVLLLLMATLTTIQINAQVSIRGKVIDALGGETLVGAHILLLEDMNTGATTDEFGQFELVISTGHLKGDILVSYIGYQEVLFSYDVSSSDTYEIALTQNETTLSNIQIKASKSVGEEFAVQQISKLEIYKNPNSRADAIRAINSLAASTNTDESANLSLRGSPPGETAIIFNNVPIEDAFRLDQSNGVGQFSIFNTSIISKVDVYPSNPPLEFGASTSGTVVLHTDDFNSTDGQSINISLAGLGVNVSRIINERNSMVLYANVGLGNGLKFLNKNAFEDIKRFSTLDGGMHWTTRLDDHSKLKVFNYTLKESYDYNSTTPSYIGISKQNKVKNLSIINYERRCNSNISIDINQGINFTNATYKFGNLEHRVNQKDFYTSLNLNRFTDFWSFKIGSSVTTNRLNNGGRYAMYYFALQPTHPSISYKITEWIVNPEFFIYNKFQLTQDLKIGLGIRANALASSGIKNYLSRQININYNIDPNNNIKISLGKYDKVFIPGEQFEHITNASSEHLSFDYSYNQNEVTISSSIYKKRTDYNFKSTDIVGAELFLAYNTSKVSSSLALTHLNAKDHISEESRPNEYDINHFVRFLLKYKITNSLELSSVILLRSGKHYSPVLGGIYHKATNSYMPEFDNAIKLQRYSGYNVWDISLSKITDVPNGSIITFVSCSNLLNNQNQQSVRYDNMYNKTGYNYFNSRVVFFGLVYNWQ